MADLKVSSADSQLNPNLRTIYNSETAALSNKKFNESNLRVLKGLIENGTEHNTLTATVQSQWS